MVDAIHTEELALPRRTASLLTIFLISMSSFALTAAPASAAGCAQLVRSYEDGGSTYADIRNVCSHTINARAVITGWPDSPCIAIAPGETGRVRASGISGPDAEDAAVC